MIDVEDRYSRCSMYFTYNIHWGWKLMAELSISVIDQYIGVVRSTFQNRAKLVEHHRDQREGMWQLTEVSHRWQQPTLGHGDSMGCEPCMFGQRLGQYHPGSNWQRLSRDEGCVIFWRSLGVYRGVRMAVWDEWMEEPWEDPVED